MQVCEEALKNLKNSKKRPIKGVLHISGDGLRVSDSETKGLVLDQTIEKVSFCAPDRNYDRGFSYICRDGTTRRWLCHGFMAVKDSGERLSHAVGCAFAICLEKKQRRDKECAVQMQYDHHQNTFTRFGSFRQGTITDRLQDPQNFKPLDLDKPASSSAPVENPNAVARPKASDLMFLRQASYRGLGKLSDNSPFKRQFSLRLSELPSTLARQAQYGDVGVGEVSVGIPANQSSVSLGIANQGAVSTTKPTNPSLGLANTCQFSPIREDVADNDLLSPDLVLSPSSAVVDNILQPTPCSRSSLTPASSSLHHQDQRQESVSSPSFNPWDNVPDQPLLSRTNHSSASLQPTNESSVLVEPANQSRASSHQSTNQSTGGQQRPTSLATDLSSLALDDWLKSEQLSNLTQMSDHHQQSSQRSRPPPLVNTKSHSLDHHPLSSSTSSSVLQSSSSKYYQNNSTTAHNNDPFDADWVGLALNDQPVKRNSKNPFLQDSLKTFELKM